jgi:acyl-CoA reductase-like NAD-dependent aldehyde dehydrogenase
MGLEHNSGIGENMRKTDVSIDRNRESDLGKMSEWMNNARSAQTRWALLPFKTKKRYILKLRDKLIEHADSISDAVSISSGKTRMDALATEVVACAMSADFYAKNARHILKPERIPMSNIFFFNKRNIAEREPLGVVGIISPWNYPLSIPFGEVVMGLMAGNAIMLKVSTTTTSVGYVIQDLLMETELPAGLFQLVTGPGTSIVDSFLANGIDKIFFTGSTYTGKLIAQKAAEKLTPVSLELGGKDAMIVLPDADLERATNGAAWAGYSNAGQSCGSVERVYVHSSVYQKFIELLSKKTEALRFGKDENFEIDVGSMTTVAQWETVDRQVKEALQKGAKIEACSGHGTKVEGKYFPPTLLTGVNHSMAIMREETFGPIIPVMPFDTIEEAIRLANDSDFGLTASIWTRDIRSGKQLARKIQAGVITINDHLYTHGQPETPWGGRKKSGIGFTHSKFGLWEMTKLKLINWDVIPAKRDAWWFPYDRNAYNGMKAGLKFLYPHSLADIIGGLFKALPYIVKKMFTRF